MKKLKQWLSDFLGLSSPKGKLDLIDEAGNESFPASDPPAWAGLEENKQASLDQAKNFKDPIAILKEEHRAIMQAMYLLHEQIERLEQNKPAQTALLNNLIDFLRQFVEEVHHQKEDSLLLPALERCGAPLGDYPLNLLKQDHETGLALLTTLEQLLPACEKNDPVICAKLLKTLNAIKDLYTRHTLKEENYIFPLAEKYLTPSTQKSLCEAFTEIDRQH